MKGPAGGAAGPGREPRDPARETVTPPTPADPGRGTAAPARHGESGAGTTPPARQGEPGGETTTPAREPAKPARTAVPTPATAIPAHRPSDPSRRPAAAARQVPRQKAAPAPADPARGPAGQSRETGRGRETGETARPAREPGAPARAAPGPARDTAVVTREPENPVFGATDLAHRIAYAVRRCPDVVDLSGGPFGTVATYLPGERLAGVALRENEVEVSVVVRLGRPLPEIADGVRAAVAPMVGNRPVNVHIGGLR
ncbi:hypothetical protein [Streptosporangium sp. LJ11]|uniref:hypothetical protein n=1 Tax=Streptosporangium sp. LJ11 TaxID=3436927 RepID=UPI003F7ACF7E